MNLHDWIDELCDVLDLETEVDEGLVNDLAELAADNVDHAAGAVTSYLLGYAAGSTGAGPVTIEKLAARAQELAERWDKPAPEAPEEPDEPDDDGADVELGFDVDDDVDEEEEE